MTARAFTEEENRILNEALRTDKRGAAKPASKDEQRIAALAKLSPLKFAQCSKQEAKDLGITLGELNRLVKMQRAQTSKGDERDFLPHWNVAPWPEEVDGDALLDDLRNHFRRYVVLPEEADVALALWVLHTWVFDCFDITPYLAITSPTRRCGKTKLMTALHWLCCRSKKNDAISKAAIYRSVEADRPTLILDEVGWVVDLKDERQGILCGGFERLGHVEICEGEGANITTKRYATFCPKAFGLIGKLTPTLMDRSIEIPMKRKFREKVERLGRRDNDEHAELRQKCRRWAENNVDALKAAPEMVAAGLNDRAVDFWEPLLIIAKQAGGEWLGRALYAAKALSGEDAAAATEDQGVELLRHIRAVFDATDWPAVTTKMMIAKLCEDDEKPWATWNSGKPISAKQLGALLRPFAIISDVVHPNQTGEPTAVRGYRRNRFPEAFDRYLSRQNDISPQDGGPQTFSRSCADGMGTSPDFSIRSETVLNVCEKGEKPANDGDMNACTEKIPQTPTAKDFDEANAEPADDAESVTDSGLDDAETTDAEFGLVPKGTPAPVELVKSSDLTIPPILDRRPQPRQDGKWAGTFVTDDDDDFIESGKFK